MALVRHSLQTSATGNHVLPRWQVATQAARLALPIGIGDIGGVCRQGTAQPYEFFLLASNDHAWLPLVGDAGGTGDLVKLSSEAMGSGRAVRYVDVTHIGLASALVGAHMQAFAGVSTTSASAAEQGVTYVTGGELLDSGWSWTPGLPVFVGANGVLTQTYSLSWAFVQIVGVALSATRLALDFKTPITQV